MAYSKKIEDLITVKDISLNDGYIWYKNVPMISCVSKTLESYSVYVLHENEHDLYFDDGLMYTIIIEDEYEDSYHYGLWNTLDEVKEWLKNPYVYQY